MGASLATRDTVRPVVSMGTPACPPRQRQRRCVVSGWVTSVNVMQILLGLKRPEVRLLWVEFGPAAPGSVSY